MEAEDSRETVIAWLTTKSRTARSIVQEELQGLDCRVWSASRCLCADRATDSTRAGGPDACRRIGLALRPAWDELDEGRRKDPRVKSAVARSRGVQRGPSRTSLFAPADLRSAPPLRERQPELRRARRVGGASGPAGRLETVQKVLHRGR